MDNWAWILFAGNEGFDVSPCPMSPFAKFLDTVQLADLGPGPRPGVSSERELNENLAKAFKESCLPDGEQQLVRSLVLLWHDHLDAAHTIAQSIENPDGSYAHAIMHRREPDYGNAAYWFRRVGQHRAFPELARRVTEFFDSHGHAALKQMLLPKGNWDPFAFVDACERAESGELSKEQEQSLREIQRVEFEVLLDTFVAVDVRRL
jgi:hypothetical protein